MAFLNDITLGHYWPGDSIVHNLDPRSKLLGLLGVMTTLLMVLNPIMLMAYALFSLFVVRLAKLPAALVFRNVRPFLWLFLITIAIHLFWTPGRSLFQVPVVNLNATHEGLAFGILYSIRLALLVIYAALLTLTTSPMELMDGLERLLNPLKRLRVPTHEIVLMLSLSLRFIPTLLEEAQRLKNAQLSRGASFDGSLFKRIQSVIPLVLPLFVSAFRRADDLALAMDARCYSGGEGRTTYKILRLGIVDWIVLLMALALLVAVIGWG
ncbi:MAG TPA: energy-coupling factor transporter transmembrane component T [bacterium]|jgi:energy-coupling factor transport system permease protein|nr:energy-coupling factor transporter transmembrane component T [bacterium]